MTALIGMVHLPALPGSPQTSLSVDQCIDVALRDADALQEGSVDGIIIENFNDVPFRPGPVDPHTVAVMTRICLEVRRNTDCRVGVNVLRNDAEAALGIAVAAGLEFIRVNVHTGAMVTDQGLITGRADRTLRTRKALDAEHIQIFADILVKHAVPLGEQSIEDAVADTVERGLADVVIVSGTGTGKVTSAADVQAAARAAGSTPVYVGSGVTKDNVTSLVPPASGLIVGSWLKIDGNVRNRVDVDRVRQIRAKLDTSC